MAIVGERRALSRWGCEGREEQVGRRISERERETRRPWGAQEWGGELVNLRDCETGEWG
jgi:hypothetical protein